MSVAIPRLAKKQVRAIKKAIVRGAPITELAEEHDVVYMTIYKIAAGLTWKKVKPRGRLIGNRDYSDRRAMSLAKSEVIALKKIQKKLSNLRIAKKLGVSESTVRRADINGRAAIAVRLDKASMNGSFRKLKKRLGLTDEQAERVSKATIPDWVRKEIEGDG